MFIENWIFEVNVSNTNREHRVSFRFVVKVYQGISGQGDWKPYYQTEEEMIAHFLDVMSPMVDAGKMFCFLVQFPSSFKCTKENVQYLRKLLSE
ncbi:hypothetical protein EfmAA610_23100 [Enterococcus faecium]|nr:hypothetical protein EfmAA610_23100 [Enterococcus faecium]